MLERFKSFIAECARVFHLTKKPTNEEYMIIVKVTGIGIIIIGLLGFLIQLIWTLIF
ncbi:MAG TPA: protein translocase SEC61 complex subunit gamma [Candidatus Nanoarchaeia archaeon]|nr:protein translocase SEC61 complex subunit gamma [Candidatus Nanoarchaeia archaeon]